MAQVSFLLLVGVGLATGILLGKDWLVWSAIILATIWTFLALRSVRVLGQVREGWGALQAGRPDLAESRARKVLASQILLRPATLSALVVLASAWRKVRPAEAAQISAFVLTRRERLLVGDRISVQMLLAESLLALGRVEGARAAMLPLYTGRLSLTDSLKLLLLQLRTEARLGAYRSMLDRIEAKVDMADLMSPQEGALTLALLWLAATRVGLVQWTRWLGRRVMLMADWAELCRSECTLKELADEETMAAPV